MNYGVIYIIQHVKTGRVYVGQTTMEDPERRFYLHKLSIGSVNHPLYNSMKKNGIDEFSFLVVDSAEDQDTLDLLEDYYINDYNSIWPNGFNLRRGGAGGKWTEYSKKKLIKTLSDPLLKERMYGWRKTKEGRLRFSESVKTGWQNQKSRERRLSIRQELNLRRNFSKTMIEALSKPDVKEKLTRARLGTRHITNGIENRQIRNDEILPDGWRYGKVFRSDESKSRSVASGHIHLGKVWITNGVNSLRVNRSLEMPANWWYGRHWVTGRKSGTMWITNGLKSTTISKDTPIPEGWFRGRIYRRGK